MGKKLGLSMQYPEGYLEAQQNKTSSCEDEEDETPVKKRGKKRKSSGQPRERERESVRVCVDLCVLW